MKKSLDKIIMSLISYFITGAIASFTVLPFIILIVSSLSSEHYIILATNYQLKNTLFVLLLVPRFPCSHVQCNEHPDFKKLHKRLNTRFIE